jgi:pimeloyl-ACP methyl ester carboxylesterase
MTFANPELRLDTDHEVRVWRAGEGPPVVCVAGPPTSSLLFRHLAKPVVAAGRSLVLPELFHPAPPSGRLADLADRIAPLVGPDALLVAHGLALPLGFEIARRVRPEGLVVLDGPLEKHDPIAAAVTKLAAAAPGVLKQALRPEIALKLLASSAALRRTVVNPYVMDRDIVAMLSAPLLATPEHRRAVVEYLASIRDIRPPWSAGGTPVLLLWSASDLLHPLPGEPRSTVTGSEVTAISLPGARFFNVEERPWEVADALLGWSSRRAATPHRDKDVVVSASATPKRKRARR